MELGAATADLDVAEGRGGAAATTTGPLAALGLDVALFAAGAGTATETPAHAGHGDDGDAIALNGVAEGGAGLCADADTLTEPLDEGSEAARGGVLGVSDGLAVVGGHGITSGPELPQE